MAERSAGTHETEEPGGGPAARVLPVGPDIALGEYVCRAGPGDRAFEERHDRVSVAAVLEGSFTYACDNGRALLHPGALLLGNHGACYRCGHEHGIGDRCLAVHVSPDYFAEIAATAAGSSRFRFPAAMLPATAAVLPQVASLEAAARGEDPLHLAEAATAMVSSAIRVSSAITPGVARPSARDERRIGRALRHAERNAADALDLDRLAAVAAMSKFHFLRTFRRMLGVTPYQFVLTLRLRRAARRLTLTTDAVSDVAFESGFGDLSTFNRIFRDRFGVSPSVFRARNAPTRRGRA